MTPERWQQIGQLFDDAVELPPPARAALLNAACAQDAVLRAEVEQMLAAHDRAGEFLNLEAAEIEAAQLAAEQSRLLTGSRVAHFEILAPLGAGAMGEVYLALDTRLARQVALKLLPARFTQDAGRLRRFAREARAASALNHPNIITVYDVGTDGALHFIAAEYVAGATLRERLSDGPLPVIEAVSIAKQVAAALSAAHAAGIVHRDIKPENVMLRADGVVKVLDFGIAKLLQKPVSDAASVPQQSTEQGTIIGTPGYMSPEQARGLDVDARTDVFSLGVVLYEMLAGHAPFRGATNADVVAALLASEPEPLKIGLELETIVKRALAKDAAQRYQSVEELLADLQAVGSGESVRFSKSVAQSGKRIGQARWMKPALAAGLLLCLLIAGALIWRYAQRASVVSDWGGRARLQFTTPFSTRLGLGGNLSRPAPAPDGQRIAFSLGGDGQMHIVVKELSNGAEIKLTDGQFRDADPVWSPDGKRLAIISQNATQRVIRTLSYPSSASSAQVMPLGQQPSAAVDYLVAWQRTPRGERIYFESYYNLFALDPLSGQVEQLTHFDQQRPVFRAFRPSPQGDRIVYLEPREKTYDVVLQSLSGAPVTLWQSPEPVSSPSWFPDGQRLALIANQGGTPQIFVLRLDTLTVEQITSGSENYSEVVAGPTGNQIFAVSSRQNANIFAWDLAAGTETEHTSEFGLQIRPEPAPDGQRLLFQTASNSAGGKMDVFVKPLVPGNQTLKLAAEAQHARWSPDGTAVAFLRFVLGKHELWRVGADGTMPRRLVDAVTPARALPTPYLAYFTDFAWSPDGLRIAYHSRKSGTSNVWLIDRDGTHDTNVTGNTDRNVNVNSLCWSPDGKRLAYLLSTASTNPSAITRSIWLHEAGKNELLYQRNATLHFVGWTSAGQELLLAAGAPNEWSAPQTVEMFRLDPVRRKSTVLLKLTATYLPSLRLARDGRTIVAVSRQQGRDNLALIDVSGGGVKPLTRNSDPTIFYSSPAWAADGRRLFYSKQASWQLLHLLEKQS